MVVSEISVTALTYVDGCRISFDVEIISLILYRIVGISVLLFSLRPWVSLKLEKVSANQAAERT
jgi:hypothetical protein